MNAIFTLLFLAAAICLLFFNPELFLSTVLDSASSAASLCVALLASYAIWLGLMQVWEDCGLTNLLSKALKPLCKRLFRTDDKEVLTAISVNLSANLLGIGGAATPYGIKAAQLLDKTEHAEYASCMFFALNATSIQLLPTSVVGIRASLGSGAPADIILPTLICTTLSTVLACFLTWLCLGRKSKKQAKFTKIQRAGAK
ncbi:MAG: nucleoside recognition protein [Clostridia bacterium]|nr:nucleoside recognition protein [Clostridia bacterium]